MVRQRQEPAGISQAGGHAAILVAAGVLPCADDRLLSHSPIIARFRAPRKHGPTDFHGITDADRCSRTPAFARIVSASRLCLDTSTSVVLTLGCPAQLRQRLVRGMPRSVSQQTIGRLGEMKRSVFLQEERPLHLTPLCLST